MPVFLPDLVVSFVGVLRRRSIQVWCGGRRVFAEGCLLGLRLQGGWVVLLLLPFAGDEGGSMAGGTRGASPADLLHQFFSFAARFKALKRWGSFCLQCSGRFLLMLPEATAEEDDGSGDERRSLQVQEFLGASFVNFCLLRDFCANVCGQLSLLYVSSMYLYGVGVVLVRLV